MSVRTHGIWLVVAAITIGWTGQTNGQERERGGPKPPVGGVFKSADAETITISVTVGGGTRERREEPVTMDKTFSLAKNVEVVVGSNHASNVGRGAGAFFKEVKLADLAAGIRVSLTLSADEKTVESMVAEGLTVRGQLNAIDATKNSLTIQMPAPGGRERGAPAAGEEKTFTLTPDAEIALDDGRGGRFSIKEGKLADLTHGALVTAKLTINLKQIQSLLAEGPSYQGIIKALDPAKKTLTLVVRPPRGDDAGEEHLLVAAGDTLVILDDGKGRRLSLKEGKLADVPIGAAATVKLSADQNFVMQIRAEGPTLTGQLKAVDADKGLIILAIFKNRGEEPEEKTLTVARDARVNIDGADSTLANLKAGDNPPMIQLRLSLDQKTVQAVTARQAGSR